MKKVLIVFVFTFIYSIGGYGQDVSVGGKAEKPAQFPGGVDSLKAVIIDNLQYPEVALDNGLQGTVIIKCIISDSGEVTEAEVVQGLSKECDAEALRVVSLLPRFLPAVYNGETVLYATRIIVPFVLPKK